MLTPMALLIEESADSQPLKSHITSTGTRLALLVVDTARIGSRPGHPGGLVDATGNPDTGFGLGILLCLAASGTRFGDDPVSLAASFGALGTFAH